MCAAHLFKIVFQDAQHVSMCIPSPWHLVVDKALAFKNSKREPVVEPD